MVLDLDSIVSEAWRQAGRHFEAVREYPYHNRSHTERTLARAMYLAEREGVDELTRAEIAIATIFHDTGFSRVYDHNEPI